MERLQCSKALLTCLVLMILLAVLPVAAKDGRDFAGFYALSNVTEAGDKVALTLTVQLIQQQRSGRHQAAGRGPAGIGLALSDG